MKRQIGWRLLEKWRITGHCLLLKYPMIISSPQDFLFDLYHDQKYINTYSDLVDAMEAAEHYVIDQHKEFEDAKLED